MRWLRPLDYETNVDEESATITTLLTKEVDKKATNFGNYDVAKYKITMDLKKTSVIRKKNKISKKLKEKFGVGADEDEEEEDNEDDDEEGEGVPTQAPLAIIQVQGED